MVYVLDSFSLEAQILLTVHWGFFSNYRHLWILDKSRLFTQEQCLMPACQVPPVDGLLDKRIESIPQNLSPLATSTVSSIDSPLRCSISPSVSPAWPSTVVRKRAIGLVISVSKRHHPCVLRVDLVFQVPEWLVMPSMTPFLGFITVISKITVLILCLSPLAACFVGCTLV